MRIKIKQIFYNIFEMIEIAEKLHEKINGMHLPKYILHDDLQPKNILKAQKRLESN